MAVRYSETVLQYWLFMKKKRTTIPKPRKDKILVKFNHQCVVCSESLHEVHHIDEDPSNHDEDNLIVLCPNCHQGKVHGKSIRITADQLKLYLRTGKKSIFNSIYHILASKIDFLQNDKYLHLPIDDISEKVGDLIEFINHLKLGEYYSKKLKDLLIRDPISFIPMSDYEFKKQSEEIEKAHKEKINNNKDEAIGLVFECLEVQD